MLFVGDVMLDRRVRDRIEAEEDGAWPFRLVAERLASADVTVANLECALARLGPPTQGDAFAGDPRALEGLTLAGVDLVSLANNHTGDFGGASLLQTIELVDEAGIARVGAGADRVEAMRATILERGGVRFGFLAFNAIGETPRATAGRPGAATIRMQPRLGPLNQRDVERFARAVAVLDATVDAVIVLPHWGAQYSFDVHPDQRTVARALVDAGADLIVGTHSHWVGGIERIGDAPVAYSLGNFVFDMDLSSRTMESIALEVAFRDGVLVSLEPIPVRITRGFRPRLAEPDEAAGILADVDAATAALTTT